jgi:hypothetical protein
MNTRRFFVHFLISPRDLNSSRLLTGDLQLKRIRATYLCRTSLYCGRQANKICRIRDGRRRRRTLATKSPKIGVKQYQGSPDSSQCHPHVSFSCTETY